MSIKNSKKKSKKEKPAHIVFLCHILTITVDKHGINTFCRKIHVSNVISRTLSYEVKGEEKWLRVWNMKSFKSSEMASFWSK